LLFFHWRRTTGRDSQDEKVSYLEEWILAKVKAAALNAYRDAARGLIK
jgi:hypothetical protein